MPKLPQSSPFKSEPRGSVRPGDPIADVLGIEGDLDAPITAIQAFGEHFAIATGDGRIAFASDDFEAADVVAAHAGCILSAAMATDGIIAGGDDGRVTQSRPDQPPRELWRSSEGKWIDHVAVSSKTVAWACGKVVYASIDEGTPVGLQHPSAIGGLAFGAKSGRLAVSHYGGVTLWDLTKPRPTNSALNWKGSHLDVTWSRDERFVITAMAENALHGWRLSDKADFAMPRYTAKPRSLSWSRKGDWLATSGLNAVMLWSFKGKKGPMGTAPDALSSRQSLVSTVAYHPLNAYLAAGYDDGAIVLARQEDAGELMVRRPTAGAITAVTWSADGRRLAYGTSVGRAGLVDFSALGPRQGRT